MSQPAAPTALHAIDNFIIISLRIYRSSWICNCSHLTMENKYAFDATKFEHKTKMLLHQI